MTSIVFNPAEKAIESQLRQVSGREGARSLTYRRQSSITATSGKADRQLVDALLAGDREAFDRFFDENAAGLYRFALTRVDYDEELAKEVTQQALCKAIAKIDTYRGESSLFTWLCSCCKYEVLGHFKKQSRQPEQVELDEETPHAEVSDTGLAGPEAEAHDSETRSLVHFTLDQIPGDYAQVLEWKYIEEASVKAIASRLGVSPKAAESRLTRARQAFKRQFRVNSSDPGAWNTLRLAAASRIGGPR